MYTKRIEDMKASSSAAKQLIQSSFDKLIVELQHRRGEMLSELDKETNNHVRKEEAAVETDSTSLGRIASSLDYIKAVKSKADKIEDLQLMSNLGKTLKDMTTEKEVTEETYERSGIIFVPLHLEYLSHIVKQTGFLRSAAFHSSVYGTTLTLKPELLPEVQQFFQSLPEDSRLLIRREGNFDELDCPRLVFDASTASDTLSLSDGGEAVSNKKPSVPVPDTRCRFKESANVLSSRAVVITKDSKVSFGMKIQFGLKLPVPECYSVLEIAMENPASDSECIPPKCPLLVMIQECPSHKRLCLMVQLGDNGVMDMPLVFNEPGVNYNLDLCFVFDGKAKKFHLINEGTAKVIVSSTLNDGFLDKPLWLRVHIEDPSLLNLTAVLCSGRQYSISPEVRSVMESELLPRAVASQGFNFAPKELPFQF